MQENFELTQRNVGCGPFNSIGGVMKQESEAVSPSVQAHRVKALDARLRTLVTALTKPTRRNSQMEDLTSVPASQWASWWAGRAKPSAELLVGACLTWPEHALWLMTGATDEIGGQISVETAAEKRQEPAIKLLRELAMYAAAYQEAGGKSGMNLDEWQADELNALSQVRKRELQRRLDRTADGDHKD
jgi:hypothetical protein